jgi:hypothetical protein
MLVPDLDAVCTRCWDSAKSECRLKFVRQFQSLLHRPQSIIFPIASGPEGATSTISPRQLS